MWAESSWWDSTGPASSSCYSLSVKRLGLFVLAIGCSHPPIHDPFEGAIHIPRYGHTDQYGRNADAVSGDPGDYDSRPETPGRFGRDIDQLQRLAERSWANRVQHEEVDGIRIGRIFADLRHEVGRTTDPYRFLKETRATLCQLGDMHFRVREWRAGGERYASGLDFSAVSGSLVVGGIDMRYETGSSKVKKGDVVLKADDEPVLEWTERHCLRPGSSPGQRELNRAELLTHQWRIEGEEPEPKKLTMARPSGGTYSLTVKWRTVAPPRKKRACVSGRKVDGKVGVLTIHTFHCPDHAMFEEQMTASLDEIGRVKDLVIDLRDNQGGRDAQAKAAAQRFLDEAPAWMRFRHHEPGVEVTAFQDEPYDPGDGPKVKAKRIWMLTGPGCASTCEIFASVMSTADHVTVVGEKTAGAVGNPKRQKLASGLVVSVPTTEYAIPGTELLIEAHGIWPDVEVRPTLDDVAAGRDPVLDAVLRRIPGG